MQAEKTELESIRLKRNIITFKKKLKVLLEQQIDLADEIDKIDLDDNN